MIKSYSFALLNQHKIIISKTQILLILRL